MEQLRRLLNSLTRKQKISLVAAAIVVGAALYYSANWTKERDFKPLYRGLAPEDAGEVVNQLQESGIEYRVADGGTAVLVPSAQVAETRLVMAASGLPRSGRIGFELFDQTNFGITDFAEKVNYHRALEGELERSVVSLSEVSEARVHITLPKDSVFLESRRPAKGSVMVKLLPGAQLSSQNIQALRQLISSGVEGLEPSSVSVLDMRGNLLSRPKLQLGDDGGESSGAMLEYRQSIEKNLLTKIHSTLEPLLGQDAFRAGVTVECDFTTGEQSEEIYDPTKSVMTSSEKTEDVSGTSRVTAGVPGTASNLPRPSAQQAKGPAGHSRRTENIAFQTSRTVRRLHLPRGNVKRISASLLLDHEEYWEGSGENEQKSFRPPPEEKIQAIREIVSGALGLQAGRGDTLIVETLPFESTRNWRPPAEEAEPESEPAIPLPDWLVKLLGDEKNVLLLGAGAAVVILLLLAGMFLLWRRRRKKRRRVESVDSNDVLEGGSAGTRALEGGGVEEKMHERLSEQAALKAKMEDEVLNSLKLPRVKTKKTEVLTKHIAEEAQKDPSAMAQLIRTWLNEEEE